MAKNMGRASAFYGRHICLIILIILLFSSCAAKISGQLDQGGAGAFSINVGLKPRLSGLIKSLQLLEGQQNVPVINGPLIAASFAKAPGVASVSLKNNSPQAIDGTIKISAISDFLAPAGGVPLANGTNTHANPNKLTGVAADFIRFEQGAGGKGGRCAVYLSREMGPGMLSLISPEITDYLEALMAPIATGEALTCPEYLDAVVSIYGQGIRNEISESTIQAFIDFPGAIQSIKNGKFSGKRAEFEIPLLDLLVLEKPLIYEVVWK